MAPWIGVGSKRQDICHSSSGGITYRSGDIVENSKANVAFDAKGGAQWPKEEQLRLMKCSRDIMHLVEKLLRVGV